MKSNLDAKTFRWQRKTLSRSSTSLGFVFCCSHDSDAVLQNLMHEREIINEVGGVKTDGLDAGFDVLRAQCAPKKNERVFARTEIARDDANIDVAPLVRFTLCLRAKDERSLNRKPLLAQVLQVIFHRLGDGRFQPRLLSRARRFSVCMSHVLV